MEVDEQQQHAAQAAAAPSSDPDAAPVQQPEANGAEATEDGAGDKPSDPAPAPPNPLIAVLTEQWKKVHEAPSDFNAWTALITTAEKLDDLERLRGVYEEFLPAYPLCFGYWRKYAEAENRHGHVDKALEVYARGTEATPYSMDLWRDYASFKKANGGTVEDVRKIYDRALHFNGADYVAHQLWDKLVALEEEHGDAQHVVEAHTRALAQPLKELPRYAASLKQYVASKPLAELLTPELVTHWTDTVKKSKAGAAEAARLAVDAARAEAVRAREAATLPPPEGLDAEAAAAAAAAAAGAAAEADQAVVAAEAAAEAAAADTSVSEDDIKAAWLAQYDAVAEASRVLAEARRPYEEGIKRTWWHVKPMDQAQLVNWVRYLEQADKQQQGEGEVLTLYERCLVPCANYPEFWERYVLWLETHGKTAEADAALQRATTLFCKQRPEAWLLAAKQAERRGQPAQARAHYAHVLAQLAPQLLTAVAAFANFERRQGDLAAARAVWEAALAKEKEALEQPGEDGKPKAHSASSTKQFAFVSMQYANFLKEVAGDAAKAREVLRDALGVAPTSRNLWEAAIHLELSLGGPDVWARVAPLFECATAEPPAPAAAQQAAEDGGADAAAAAAPTAERGLPEKDREELSARSVEVADAHGSLAEALAAERAHAARFPVPASLAAGGGGAAADGNGSAAAAAAATGAGYGAVAARKRAPEPDYYGAGGYGGYGQGGYKAPRGPEAGASPHVAAYGAAHHGYPPAQGGYGGYGAAAGGYGQAGGYSGGYAGHYGGYY